MTDKIYWTQPANNTNVYAGCPVELGYRVQYSDLALLHWVQLQVLDITGESVLVNSIDHTTRDVWDSQNFRGKNVTWVVPSHWAEDDYILRAFGNSTYPCSKAGVRTRCVLELEDRQVVHLKRLTKDENCTSVLLRPNMIDTGGSLGPGSSSGNSTSAGTGTTGYATSMHIVMDPSSMRLIQQNGASSTSSSTTTTTSNTAEHHPQQQPATNTLPPGTAGSEQQHQDIAGMIPSTSLSTSVATSLRAHSGDGTMAIAVAMAIVVFALLL
ncbi:hypothetical protein BGZ94_001093 [Podila epigama]|nr:hypothetical protein BGZ94_001093 [Podila epigama]